MTVETPVAEAPPIHWIGAAEVAKLLGCSSVTIGRLARKAGLTIQKGKTAIGATKLLYDRAEINRLEPLISRVGQKAWEKRRKLRAPRPPRPRVPQSSAGVSKSLAPVPSPKRSTSSTDAPGYRIKTPPIEQLSPAALRNIRRAVTLLEGAGVPIPNELIRRALSDVHLTEQQLRRIKLMLLRWGEVRLSYKTSGKLIVQALRGSLPFGKPMGRPPKNPRFAEILDRAPSNEWERISKVAKTTKLPLRTLYHWITDKRLPARMIGGTVRIRVADVLAAQTKAPGSGPKERKPRK